MLVVKILGKEVLAELSPGEGPTARENLHRQSEWEE